MTTYVPFVPNPATAFSFTAVLDGTSYTLGVPWNVFGQRWYLNCTGPNGEQIFQRALIGSPNGNDIELIGPWFEVSTMVFRSDSQTFEINP